jgi:hydrogenase expression/formation protein HypE
MSDESGLSCPRPLSRYDHIVMAHGGGGRLMQALIQEIFLPAFGSPQASDLHDGVVLEAEETQLAFTTDSYVVKPLFFPGGDIGSLAVNGTVNDLAMCGAEPRYLSAGFVLEEGLPLADLQRVVTSMQAAAERAGVQIVTGDTKVVERGHADGLFVNTAGVGVVRSPQRISPRRILPGDAVVVSGDLGRHGIAVMATRAGLNMAVPLASDCASVADLVGSLLAAGLDLHCLRDLTRGGLASALLEIAAAASRRIRLHEEALPVRPEIEGACEILGLDPLYVANEGRFVAILPAEQAAAAVEILRRDERGQAAAVVGEVEKGERGQVTLVSSIGGERLLDLLSGEQLPRIC